MNHALIASTTRPAHTNDRRTSCRQPVELPALLTWRDSRGTARFANVTTRDLSDFGAFVECDAAIPMYRLVTLQVDDATARQLPSASVLAGDKVLAAVYRTVPARPERGTRTGYALRLLIEPRRQAVREIA
ncbi:MAG TPA: hypothetical protein VIC33_13235 [Vicinamibacterales bacterium]